MTTWTPVTPAANTTWTSPANSAGTQIYDEASLTYDNSTTFYDSTNPNTWTSVVAATGTSWTNVPLV